MGRGGSMGTENVFQFFSENDKIANNSTTTEAKEEINTDLESLQILEQIWWTFDQI